MTDNVFVRAMGAPGPSGIPPNGLFVLTDISDVAATNAKLVANAGKEIWIVPRAGDDPVQRPDTLAAGAEIMFPVGTKVRLVGNVRVEPNNPAVGCFMAVLAATNANLDGQGHIEFNYGPGLGRPNLDWVYGVDAAFATWATTWNTAHPGYEITLTAGLTFKQCWNASPALAHTPMVGWLGFQGGTNRNCGFGSSGSDGVWSYGQITVSNCHVQFNFQGNYVTPTSWTYGCGVAWFRHQVHDFGVIYKRQWGFALPYGECQEAGVNINHAPGHGVYGTNDAVGGESSWYTWVGEWSIANYVQHEYFKFRANMGMAWGLIRGKSMQNLVTIGQGSTGIGGPVIMRDHLNTGVQGSGTAAVVRILDCPGWVGTSTHVDDEWRAGADSLQAYNIQNSPGGAVRGQRLRCATTTGSDNANLLTESDGFNVGFTDYGDDSNNGARIWAVSGKNGGVNVAVFDGFKTYGSHNLVEYLGGSGNNIVRVDRTLISPGYDYDKSVLNSGYGTGNSVEFLDNGDTVRSVTSDTAFITSSSQTFTLNTYTDDEGDSQDYNFTDGSKLKTIGPSGTITYTGVTPWVDAPYNFFIDPDPVQSIKNAKAAINASAGAGTLYGTGTPANPDVQATSAGDQLSVQARTPGAAGDTIQVRSTLDPTYGAWFANNLQDGGLPKSEVLFTTWLVDASAAPVVLEISGAPAANDWIKFVKIDNSTNTVTTTNDDFTLAKLSQTVELNSDGTGWFIPGQNVNWALQTLAGQIVTAAEIDALANPLEITNRLQYYFDQGGKVLMPPMPLDLAPFDPVGTDEGGAIILSSGDRLTIQFQPDTVLRPISNKVQLIAINGATNTMIVDGRFENPFDVLQGNPDGALTYGTGANSQPNGGVALLGNTACSAIMQYRGGGLKLVGFTSTGFTSHSRYVGDMDDQLVTDGDFIVSFPKIRGGCFGMLVNQPNRFALSEADAWDLVDSYDNVNATDPGHLVYIANRAGAAPDLVTVEGVRASGCSSSPLKLRKGAKATVVNADLWMNGRGLELEDIGEATVTNLNVKLATTVTDSGRNALLMWDCGPSEVSNCMLDISGTDAWAVRMQLVLPKVAFANQFIRLRGVTAVQDFAGGLGVGKAPLIANQQVDLIVDDFRHVHPGSVAGGAIVDLRGCTRARINSPVHAAPDLPTDADRLVYIDPDCVDTRVNFRTSDLYVAPTANTVNDNGTGTVVRRDGVLTELGALTGVTEVGESTSPLDRVWSNRLDLTMNTSAPASPNADGTIFGADGATYDPNQGAGLYARLGAQTQKISLTGTGVRAITGNNVVLAAYNKTVTINRTAATLVTLSALSGINDTVVFVDIAGNNATFNTTIGVDGTQTLVGSGLINTNSGFAWFRYLGANVWARIG